MFTDSLPLGFICTKLYSVKGQGVTVRGVAAG